MRIFCFLALLAFSSVAAAFELGNPADFAIRIDDKTGNLSEIVYKGQVVTTPGASEQRFDILQNDKWAFGLAGGKLELVDIKKESDSTVMVTQKVGDWTITFRYVLSGRPTTLSWNTELLYTGKETTKIKSFWMSYPLFPFGDDAEFIVPGLYPPRTFTPKNFGVGAKQGLWRSGSPLVFQLDKTKSVLLFSDQLESYADRPGGDVSRNENGVRLVQSFGAQGHVQPGLRGMQHVGVGALRIVDGNAETALLKLHDLMRHFGHSVPKDRPKWFEEAIAYSFHPGGTIGSGCKDLGGFVPATKFLDRIKELGCNTIWFLPLEDKSIYWPRDYYKFQEGLGMPEEFQALVDRAHELDMKVLMDSVPHGGSNTYQRMIDHPEWLAQNEDGSTLHYWCADFNWPTWINYMAEVSRFYVKTYGIDGFRIDACGGSKIPNWNPKIPYSRASHSQSQGGLNMVRAIRQAVKDENPDGATLAEVGGGLFGAVSDAVYDFDLCYNVLHDARKQTPEEFVKRLRRWLHEQQYSEVPDLLRLRHVESHDSLRGQLWYGTEPHRALMALTAFIHGIPLVYHEQEIGNENDFRTIFGIRTILPELNGGDADYLGVDAPPGVFAFLRTKGDDASLVAINLTGRDVEGILRMSWNKLPEKLKTLDRIEFLQAADFEHEIKAVKKEGDELRVLFTLPCYQSTFEVVILRERVEATRKQLRDFVTSTQRYDPNSDLSRPDPATFSATFAEKTEQGDWRLSAGQWVALVDAETGFLKRFESNGKALIDPMDCFLPPEVGKSGKKASFTAEKDKLVVRRSFGRSVLEIVYRKGENSIRFESRWLENPPTSSAFAFPIVDASHWSFITAEGSLSERFLVRHRPTDGVYGSIYRRPQGSNVFFDSLMNSMAPVSHGLLLRGGFLFSTGRVPLAVGLPEAPLRLRLLDRIGDQEGLHLLLSLTDEDAPKLPSRNILSVEFGEHAKTVDPIPAGFRPVTGGWIYENDYYKLRLTRSGTIMSLENKKSNKIIHQGDLYTDYGYGTEKMRYAAGNDVEAGCRIVQDGDTLRLRFEGQLRGFGRFDLMRPPVEYFTEYALSEKSPAFGFSCGVKTHRIPTDNRAFLALMLPMPEVERFEYFKDGKSLAEGSNVDAKGRSFQTKEKRPDRVVLKSSSETLLELTGLKGETSNLFLDHKNFFVTFDDGDARGTPTKRRSFEVTFVCGTGSKDFVAPKTGSGSRKENEDTPKDNLIVDGGFEAPGGGDLVSLRTGTRFKGEKRTSRWQTPTGGKFSFTEFHGGRTSAQVDGETAQYRLFSQDVRIDQLKPEQKLRLSAFVKGRDLKAGPEGWQVGCVRFVAVVDGQIRYHSSPNLTGTFDWKEVEAEFSVPEKLQRLSIQAGSNGAAGTIWIDDVFVQEIK